MTAACAYPTSMTSSVGYVRGLYGPCFLEAPGGLTPSEVSGSQGGGRRQMARQVPPEMTPGFSF